jgi:hypothetical protein
MGREAIGTRANSRRCPEDRLSGATEMRHYAFMAALVRLDVRLDTWSSGVMRPDAWLAWRLWGVKSHTRLIVAIG